MPWFRSKSLLLLINRAANDGRTLRLAQAEIVVAVVAPENKEVVWRRAAGAASR